MIKQKADVDADGGITYSEFIPVVKDLLAQVYAKKDNDWNDWCKVSSGWAQPAKRPQLSLALKHVAQL